MHRALKATWLALGLTAALLASVGLGAAGVFVWGLHHQGDVPASDGPPGDRAHTRYPIVLVHGMMGFDRLHVPYAGDMSYWYDIVPRLRAQGAEVYTTSVSAFEDSEVRGQQLLPQIEDIVRRSGARKVHLIGHSQGSQAARYVAAMRPDLVASVTAVAGPTMGSEVADWLQRMQTERPWVLHWATETALASGHLTNEWSGHQWPQRPLAAMDALSTTGAAAFNRKYPDGVPTTPCGEGAREVHGVRYYSWMGVGHYYSVLNGGDLTMWLTGHLFDREREDNDGLVGRCASHLGEVLGDHYPMNHLHAVRLFGGLTMHEPDPATLYIDHASRLKALGL